MSLVLAGLIVAGASGAAIVGRWLAKRKNADDVSADVKDAKDGDGDADERSRAEAEEAAGRSSEDPHADPPKAGRVETHADPQAKPDAGRRADEGKPKEKEKPKKARRVEGPMAHLEGFPCQLGDVIMRITGEEAWLAGGLVLSEDVPVAALFVAPDAGHDCAVYVRPSPRTALYWLEPLDPKAVLVGGEPPTSVEHGGIRFDRARRLPLRPKRIGVGAPDAGDALVVAEYHSAGAERLVVMKSTAGSTHAYRGVELEASTYEVIASGRSTLDEA